MTGSATSVVERPWKSPNGGSISKRQLLSIEGGGSPGSKTLFDVLLPVAPPRPQT